MIIPEEYILGDDGILNEAESKIYKVDKRLHTVSTRFGASVKYVYKIQTKLEKQKTIGIVIIATPKGRVKIKIGYIDKFDNIISDGVYMINVMVLRFYRTLVWCFKDWKKDFPEYRKYYIS